MSASISLAVSGEGIRPYKKYSFRIVQEVWNSYRYFWIYMSKVLSIVVEGLPVVYLQSVAGRLMAPRVSTSESLEPVSMLSYMASRTLHM